MKIFVQHLIVTVMLVSLPSAAMAQRVPATDSSAVGGEVGLFMGRLGVQPALEGFYEYYFSPRTSVRLGLGWARPDMGEQYLRVPVDVFHSWGGGAVHPFVGAGLGIYFVEEEEFFDGGSQSETTLGGTLFGGVEFFTSRTAAVKVEARYHAIRNTFGNPDGLSISVGFKRYF